MKCDLLPAEVIVHIFSFLDVKPLCSVRYVCKFWKIQSDNQILWKALTLKYFGIHSIKDENWKKYFMELYQHQFAKEFITFDPISFPVHNPEQIKVTVVGDSKVGKTLYLMTCLKMIDKWDTDKRIPTGIDAEELEIKLKETSARLNLWDALTQSGYER